MLPVFIPLNIWNLSQDPHRGKWNPLHCCPDAILVILYWREVYERAGMGYMFYRMARHCIFIPIVYPLWSYLNMFFYMYSFTKCNNQHGKFIQHKQTLRISNISEQRFVKYNVQPSWPCTISISNSWTPNMHFIENAMSNLQDPIPKAKNSIYLFLKLQYPTSNIFQHNRQKNSVMKI